MHVCSFTSVVSKSVRCYGLQSARLLCPWDSPGKNTGVGGHDLLPGIFSTQGSSPHLMHLLICWQILYPLSHLENPSVQFSRSVVFDSLRPYGLYPTRVLCPWHSPGKNTRVGCHALLQEVSATQGSSPHFLQFSGIAGRFFTAEPPKKP